MSREEVVYNWLKYVQSLIKRYFLMKGEVVQDDELFQRRFPPELWEFLRILMRNLVALPIWVNHHSISSSVFGGKQNYDYWKTIFDTGKTPSNQDVLAKPLNLDDLIAK
jgi:hypothetical protein